MNYTRGRIRSSSLIKEEETKLQQSRKVDLILGNSSERSGNEEADRASGCHTKTKISEIAQVIA